MSNELEDAFAIAWTQQTMKTLALQMAGQSWLERSFNAYMSKIDAAENELCMPEMTQNMPRFNTTGLPLNKIHKLCMMDISTHKQDTGIGLRHITALP